MFFADKKEERTEALRVYEEEEQGDVAYRDRKNVKGKLEHDKNSAAQKVKDIEARWFDKAGSWVKHLFGKGAPAEKRLVDKKLTEIAEEKAKKVQAELENSGVEAYRQIAVQAEKSNRSLVLLNTKIDLAKEVLEALTEEVDELEKLRARYENMAGQLGMKAKKIDLPKLNDAKVKRGVVKTIEGESEKRVRSLKGAKVMERAEKVDNQLRQFLVNVDPTLAPRLERILVENASGTNKNLDDAIAKLLEEKKIDQSEFDLFMAAAKELRGEGKWWGRWGKRLKQKDVSAYYLARIQRRGELNPQDEKEEKPVGPDPLGTKQDALDKKYNAERMEARIKSLIDLPVGQSVHVGMPHDQTANLVVVRKESNMIILESISGDKMVYAIGTELDSDNDYHMTGREKGKSGLGVGAGGGDKEWKLSAPKVRDAAGKLKDAYKDPTKLYFGAKAVQ